MKKTLTGFLFLWMTLGMFLAAVAQSHPEPPAGRVAYAVQGTPKVDGKIDAIWKSTPAVATDQPVKTLNDSDLNKPARASVRLLWDARALYLLAEVVDGRIETKQGADWDQDSVEIFLDELLTRETSYGKGHGHYRINADGKLSFGSGSHGQVRRSVQKTPQGYRVEASIEWMTLQPRAGARVGFEAQVNDNAGRGRRQALMKWNDPSNRSWRDPSTLGTLVLTTADQLEVVRKKFPSQDAPSDPVATPTPQRMTADQRVPDWAAEAVYYQIFPERFRNGDPSNDPTRESLEFPDIIPASWEVTPWTRQWYSRAKWESQMGDNFYEDGVFHRRLGGDLQGVLDKLDYLQSLGINVIYFNPVFYARSMHKYDGNSFHHVDPHFGPDPAGDFALMRTETADPATWKWTAADQLFLKLIQEAHARDIRVIIDGVFNHTGRDFFAFQDIVKKGKKSSYVDWYMIENFDDPSTDANELKYKCWWGVDTLPEFADNADGSDLHPAPKAYVFEATKRWMDPNGDGQPDDGIDGWRLDVANEVPNQFWRDWNRHVRQLNPQAFTVAEIWEDAGGYLGDCGFSSTMNYHGFAFPAKGFLVDGRMPASRFVTEIQNRMEAHPQRVRFALQNLMDSHDTDRLASMIVNARNQREYRNAEKFDYDVGERVSPRHFPEYDVSGPTTEDRRIQRLVALFQFTFVGAPMIYYGTEAGMDGADDPDDRMPMVWDDLEYEPRDRGPYGKLTESYDVRFQAQLHAYYSALTKFRKSNVALNHGGIQFLYANDDQQTICYERSNDEQSLLVVLNRSHQEQSIQVEPKSRTNGRWVQVFNSTGADEGTSRVEGQRLRLTVPGNFGAIWQWQETSQRDENR